MEETKNFPTMIIPDGTEIGVNEQNQLSIKTPGNLVIQNSAKYCIIESGNGSVRIDPDVKVEVISLQAADTCYVAGELTAWRVRAEKIILEKGARANIMLQESESLELDRAARLVGNFSSEKELYLTLGRFSRQLQELPDTLTPGKDQEPPKIGDGPTEPAAPPTPDEEPFIAPDGEDETPAEDQRKTDETLSLVRIVVERELGRSSLDETGRQALEQLLDLIRTQNLVGVSEKSAYLLSQVASPSEDLLQAHRMLSNI
ncbi:MAG: hypothetical protein K8R59_01280 [Thermoanaerobaculales bacterium]|nr:hypothetical protein [Thermoanaerobaculales bacterium]